MNSQSSSDRLRIARELHDGIAQEVAAIGYRLDEVIGREKLPQEIRRDLRNIRALVSSSAESIRDQIFMLRGQPSRSFKEATESLVESLLDGFDVIANFDFDDHDPGPFKFDLLKILQELIINILRHSQASSVVISFHENCLIISDDGIGISQSTENRFGLLGVRERVALIGGNVEVFSSNSGTRVVISVPHTLNS